MISTAIQQLVNYGLDTGLILPDDEIYIRNQLTQTSLKAIKSPYDDIRSAPRARTYAFANGDKGKLSTK